MRTDKPRVLFAHVTTDADKDRDDYENDRRNDGWSIRTYDRTIRADGVSFQVRVMVVRAARTSARGAQA